MLPFADAASAIVVAELGARYVFDAASRYAAAMPRDVLLPALPMPLALPHAASAMAR